MRVLPWGRNPYMTELFFVVRELWCVHASSLELYVTSNPLTIDNDGVCIGGQKIAFMRTKYNLVYKHLKHLDKKYWRLTASYANTSHTSLYGIYVDCYIDLNELSKAIKTGTRFCGREILFSQLCANHQEIRRENYILEKYGRNGETCFLNAVTEAFDNALVPSYESKIDVSGLRTTLYAFQRKAVARMLELEESGTTFEEISKKYTCMSCAGATVWLSKNDTLHHTEDCETVEVQFKGGFLTDNMGMGKTLTLIALCSSRLIQSCEVILRPKSTLVICPSHIISHWKKEIDKHTDLRYVCITVKDQIEKIKVKNIMSDEAPDFVLVSFNMFCNPLFRGQMDYYSCSVAKKGEAFSTDFQRQSKRDQENQNFIPHIFDWGRIIIDEFHELGNACYPSVSTYVSSLKSDTTWFVSGTPLVNMSLYRQFIPNMLLGEEICSKIPINDVSIKLIGKSTVKNHNYDEVEIPPFKEKVHRIELNKSERIIYDGIRTEGREQQLKVCSYARLAKCLIAETEVESIDEMKELVKTFLTNKINELKKEIEQQDVKIQQLQVLVPDLEARTRESYTLKQLIIVNEKSKKYLNDTKITAEYVKKTEQTECVICLESMEFPCVIKTCGHKICDTCLPLAMERNKKCPICRIDYTVTDVIKINKGGDNKMLMKYGSKLYHLFQLLERTPEVKTLIFSQWDELLKDVGKCITTFDETRKILFCRGNVMQKQASIIKFSNDSDHNILLLSTLNSGSGCDLSLARRVILLDTVDGTGEFITGIERQAIARCHRIGQTKSVEVVRFIAKDTIEEEIYDRIREVSLS